MSLTIFLSTGCLSLPDVATSEQSDTSLSSAQDSLATATPAFQEQEPVATETINLADNDGPQMMLDIDPAKIGFPSTSNEDVLVHIGLFLTVRSASGNQARTEAEAFERIRNLIRGANFILEPCQLYLTLEMAQVIALPERLLRLQGNEAGSWGGHPPVDTENVERFNYKQNERLTDDTRELFSYGKQHTAPNTISVFMVEHITYYAEQKLTAAGGLSFPPNVYHHPDDYPLRNSVLLVEEIPADRLPFVNEFSMHGLAHEIGHMLLNSGDHSVEPQNLMASLGGINLTANQCERMRHNLAWLYGVEAVPDPGPPTDQETK